MVYLLGLLVYLMHSKLLVSCTALLGGFWRVLVGRNSKSGVLEFLVYFSPSLVELVDRNSKYVLLEFLV